MGTYLEAILLVCMRAQVLGYKVEVYHALGLIPIIAIVEGNNKKDK